MIKAFANCALVATIYWAARGDLCILSKPPVMNSIDLRMMIVWLLFQLAPTVVIFLAINSRWSYFSAINLHVRSSNLKAALLFLPPLLLLFSHHPLVFSYYNSGDELNKIDRAKNVELSMGRCCILPFFYKCDK